MGIKELRKAAGLTQRALAEAAGIHISQVNKLESGEIKAGNMTARAFIRLANALDIDPKTLLEVTEDGE